MTHLLAIARLLQKMQTPPDFPRLGVHGNQRETPVLAGRELRNKRILVGKLSEGDASNLAGCTLLPDPEGKLVSSASFAGTDFNAPLATKQHEDLHHMFNRVERRHGPAARQKLAEHLCSAIDPADFKSAAGHAQNNYPGLGPESPMWHEEVLAELVSYLNGGGRRARRLGASPDLTTDRAMKRAWRNVQARSTAVTPDDICR